ncbi:MAG: rhodanese-like domain-containing protein [Pseudomonadota bacterium]|nr:rhodanese-like domain-containing protein [Pseudomonadota bacterium]
MPLGPPFIDPPSAAALVANGATILDTRPMTAYLAGHVPGAVRVDWKANTVGGPLSGVLGPPESVAERYAALGVDAARPVLVVGAWANAWGEEGRVAWDLTWLGHRAVHILEGGMPAWTGVRERLPARAVPGTLTAAPRTDLRVSTEALAAALAAGHPPVLLDVRDPDEFEGARKFRESRGGHIPGARNVPWRGLFANPPDLPRDIPLVVYCTGGVRSGMAWAALTAHGYTVANNDGSWWAWARTQPE